MSSRGTRRSRRSCRSWPTRNDHARSTGERIAMPVFDYEVVNAAGALSRGRAEADDPGSLMARFREAGQTLVTVRTVEQRRPFRAFGTEVERLSNAFQRGVSLTTLVVFTGQLAAMLAGGLHLARILNSLAAESVNKRF